MIALVARLVFPVTLILAAALWVRSYGAIGEGFGAGATAGLGAGLQYVALDRTTARRRTLGRHAGRLMAGGVLIVVGVVLAPLLFGLPPVSHWPRPTHAAAHIGMLELHTAALLDLGVAVSVYGAVTANFDRLFPPGREPDA